MHKISGSRVDTLKTNLILNRDETSKVHSQGDSIPKMSHQSNILKQSKRLRDFLKTLGLPIIKLFLFVLTFIELPYFLIKNRAIFKNDILYVFWIPSFGHTFSGLDFASRLYYPHRISLVYFNSPSSNEYLPFIFPHNIDPFIFKSIIPPLRARHDAIRFWVMRFSFLLISAVFQRFDVIEHDNTYRALSLALDQIRTGKEELGITEKEVDYTGYIKLLHDKMGKKPRLPENLREQCRAAILKFYPEFFNKPFITVLLRNKGLGGPLDATFRNPDTQTTYIKALEYFASKGFHLVGEGETDPTIFGHIPGYYSLKSKELGVSTALLNIYFLTECTYFVGQQSGPLNIPNSCGLPCLIVDAMPHRLGTFNPVDLILFKNLVDQRTGHELSFVEIYRDKPELALGYRFGANHIKIVSNTEDEILAAVKEFLAIQLGDFKLSHEDLQMVSAFHTLPGQSMAIKYQKNRPPLFQLSRCKTELLKLQS